MNFLSGFFTQLLFTAGIIFIFGWLISLLRRGFCNLMGRSGPVILLATGIIGTPIHELSHALMCLLFGHKITDIKLYNPKSEDGALGYVSHTYNKKNIYHQIGNFFVGVAPVLISGGVVILLLAILLPDAFDMIALEIKILCEAQVGAMPLAKFFTFIWASITAIFSAENFSDWQGWLFVILAFMISTHMEMSGSDIKSGLRGLAFITVIMFLIDGLIYLISPDAFHIVTDAIASCGFAIAAILSISVLFLLALLIIAILLRGIGMIFSR
ncbi:MAG: DUF3267 domain-containing protein [Clostridia bacterium]|nr:DUF3267 domain-containing protein [Clostridia bacterium]